MANKMKISALFGVLRLAVAKALTPDHWLMTDADGVTIVLYDGDNKVYKIASPVDGVWADIYEDRLREVLITLESNLQLGTLPELSVNTLRILHKHIQEVIHKEALKS